MKTLASTTGYTKLYYLDVIPWYVRAYVHTVKVTLDGATIVDGRGTAVRQQHRKHFKASHSHLQKLAVRLQLCPQS